MLITQSLVKANLKAETDGAICLSDTANGRTSAKTKHIVKKFLTLRPHFSVGYVIVGNSITLAANREDESFGYNHVCLTDSFMLAFRML